MVGVVVVMLVVEGLWLLRCGSCGRGGGGGGGGGGMVVSAEVEAEVGTL